MGTEERENNQDNEYEIKRKVKRVGEKSDIKERQRRSKIGYFRSLRKQIKQLDRERFITIIQRKFLESQDNLSLHIERI